MLVPAPRTFALTMPCPRPLFSQVFWPTPCCRFDLFEVSPPQSPFNVTLHPRLYHVILCLCSTSQHLTQG